MPKYPKEIYKIAEEHSRPAKRIVDDVRKSIPYNRDICYRTSCPWYLTSLDTLRIVTYLHTTKQVLLTGSRVIRLRKGKKNG